MNIIIDLEHTISDASHRIDKTFIKGEFQKEFVNDRPNNNVITFMKQLSDENHTLIILTAKSLKYQDDVRNWLRLHNVVYMQLILKDTPDFEETSIEFKERFIKNYKEKIAFALNDVGKECAMFAKYNIPCLRVAQK